MEPRSPNNQSLNNGGSNTSTANNQTTPTTTTQTTHLLHHNNNNKTTTTTTTPECPLPLHPPQIHFHTLNNNNNSHGDHVEEENAILTTNTNRRHRHRRPRYHDDLGDKQNEERTGAENQENDDEEEEEEQEEGEIRPYSGLLPLSESSSGGEEARSLPHGWSTHHESQTRHKKRKQSRPIRIPCSDSPSPPDSNTTNTPNSGGPLNLSSKTHHHHHHQQHNGRGGGGVHFRPFGSSSSLIPRTEQQHRPGELLSPSSASSSSVDSRDSDHEHSQQHQQQHPHSDSRRGSVPVFSSSRGVGSQSGVLSNHNSHTHTHARIFNPEAYCELCNKEFCNKYFLKTHKANKHGVYSHDGGGGTGSGSGGLQLMPTTHPLSHGQSDAGPPPPPPPLSSTSSRDSFCVLCNKDFCNKYFLRRHRAKIHGIIHQGTSPATTPYESMEEGETITAGDISHSTSGGASGGRKRSRNHRHQHQQQHGASSSTSSNASSNCGDSAPRPPAKRDAVPGTTVIVSSAVTGDRATSPSTQTSFPSFECPLCSHSFPSLYLLQLHTSYFHSTTSFVPSSSPSPYQMGIGIGETSGYLGLKLSSHSPSPPTKQPQQEEQQQQQVDGGASAAAAAAEDDLRRLQSMILQLSQGHGGGGLPPSPATVSSASANSVSCPLCCKEFYSSYFLSQHIATAHAHAISPFSGGSGSMERSSTALLQQQQQQQQHFKGTTEAETANDESRLKETENETEESFRSGQGSVHMVPPPSSEMMMMMMMMGAGGVGSSGADDGSNSIVSNVVNSGEPGAGRNGTSIGKKSRSSSSTAPSRSVVGSTGGPHHRSSPDDTSPRIMATSTPPAAASTPTSLIGAKPSSAVGVVGSGGKPVSPSLSRSYCTICHKELCNKYFMRTHMLKMHGINIESSTGLGGVTCDICHKELCSKYFLKVHKQNTHGIVDEQLGAAPTGGGPATLFPGGNAGNATPELPSLCAVDEEMASGSGGRRSHTESPSSGGSGRPRSSGGKWIGGRTRGSGTGFGGGEDGDEGEGAVEIKQETMAPSASPRNVSPNETAAATGPDDLGFSEETNGESGRASCGSASVSGSVGLVDPLSLLLQKMEGGSGGRGKLLYCRYCSFTTSLLVYLYAHERSHTNPTHAQTSTAYTSSAESGRSGGGQLQCPMCFLTFGTVDHFQQHLVLNHHQQLTTTATTQQQQQQQQLPLLLQPTTTCFSPSSEEPHHENDEALRATGSRRASRRVHLRRVNNNNVDEAEYKDEHAPSPQNTVIPAKKELELLQRRACASMKTRSFKCSGCGQRFAVQTDAEEHIRNTHARGGRTVRRKRRRLGFLQAALSASRPHGSGQRLDRVKRVRRRRGGGALFGFAALRTDREGKGEMEEQVIVQRFLLQPPPPTGVDGEENVGEREDGDGDKKRSRIVGSFLPSIIYLPVRSRVTKATAVSLTPANTITNRTKWRTVAH